MTRILTFGFALAPPALAAGVAVAMAPKADSAWSPVDYNFAAQANLGAPFQIASGQIAEEKATTANIRDYAHLMAVSHIPVVDALAAILGGASGLQHPPTLCCKVPTTQ